MKRPIVAATALLLATLLVLAVAAPAGAASQYRVTVNGRAVQGADPLIRSGQLLAAAAPLAAALGARVSWNNAEQRLDLTLGSERMAFWAGSRTVYKNGRRLVAPVATGVYSRRVYLPAWFVARQLGFAATWDGAALHLRGSGPPARGPGAPPGRDTDRVSAHPLAAKGFVFPFPRGSDYQPYDDNYGTSRGWSPDGPVQRSHEGIDILADTWTPLVAVANGQIAVMGWNEYGGWRLQLRPDAAPRYRIYYAHLAGFAKGLRQGAWVRAGQVIGYVGSSGYGPPGTTGQFVPHLHLGIYPDAGGTINPYPFLLQWEARRG